MSVTSHIGAIDMGGTHVRGALVTCDGKVVWRERTNTPRHLDRPDFLADLAAAIAQQSPDGLAQLVVGIPGIIDYRRGELVAAPNIPQAWTPFLRESWLAEQVGLPVSLANDADLAAVGETFFGAAVPYHDAFYVTISTGVGGGAVLGRRLMRGRYSAGEIGHTVVDFDNLDHNSTVEQIGAGPAIARAAAAAGIDQRDQAFMELLRDGHKDASLIWQRAIAAVSVGIVNLAWVLSPEIVVVGGGVGNNSDLVLPPIRAALDQHGPNFPIEVAGAVLGDDAGLVGAASWFEAVGR